MNLHPSTLLLAFGLILWAACAPVRDDDDSAGDDDDDATDPPPEDCTGVGSSTLAGACIFFESAGGSWSLSEAAAGIEIPYTVLVEAEIPGVVNSKQDAGGCGQPGPSGLILFEDLGGDGERYCLCDTGLCADPPQIPVTIPASETSATFAWTGTNWWGPSDTGNPLGEPFPAGTYTLEVSALGAVDSVEFAVSNSFEVTLTN